MPLHSIILSGPKSEHSKRYAENVKNKRALTANCHKTNEMDLMSLINKMWKQAPFVILKQYVDLTMTSLQLYEVK